MLAPHNTDPITVDVGSRIVPVVEGSRGAVERMLAALESAGVDCVLLRPYEPLGKPGQGTEVDLLVAPTHLDRAAAALTQHAYVRIPSKGHAPHTFFLGYDESNDAWIKFDIVTDIRFGRPIRALTMAGLAREFLANKQRSQVAAVLSSEDRLLKLLLSCLLNEGEFAAEARCELARLHALVTSLPAAQQRIAALLWDCFGVAFHWGFVSRAIEQGSFDQLLGRRGMVLRRLLWKSPAASAFRFCTGALARRVVSNISMRGRGMLVALLAPDGAGKSTLASALAGEPHLRASVVYMGPISRRRIPRLPFATQVPGRPQWPLLPKNRADRWLRKVEALFYLYVQARRMAWAYRECMRGRVVVFDRYFYDTWVKSVPRTFLQGMRRRLLRAISPTPDLVLVLDAPGPLLFQRKKEHSPEYLESARAAYRTLSHRLPQAVLLDSSADLAVVRRQAISAIWRAYSEKRNGHIRSH